MKPPNKLERRVIAHRVNFFLQNESIATKRTIFSDAIDDARYQEMYMLYIDIIGLANETPE